ncbi:hypothetical protein CgunFtcFv8_023400 [Champsocephalus gunnari]|nr:hypothetical protein CgunFtcFv8_023400 [Champsocephalus gunnari]
MPKPTAATTQTTTKPKAKHPSSQLPPSMPYYHLYPMIPPYPQYPTTPTTVKPDHPPTPASHSPFHPHVHLPIPMLPPFPPPHYLT